MNLISENGESNGLSNFNNPFDKDGVTSVVIEYDRKPSCFHNDKHGKATIKFKNGDTSGYQYFYSDDFQDLVKQVDTFIKSLK